MRLDRHTGIGKGPGRAKRAQNGVDVVSAAGALNASGTPAPMATEAKPDAEGFLRLTKMGVYDDFAQDLTATEKAVLYATNAPTNVKALGGTITKAAWHDKPSWYVVAANDRAIQPSLEAEMAKTIHATTTTVKSSHVAMLAKAAEVARVIERAAAH